MGLWRFTLLFSEKEKLFSLFQFIAHCGNLFWAHQKVYNITQLSYLELWLLWCCLDSSRFCKQPGLALQHKVRCSLHHILYMVFLHLTLAMGAVAWPLTGKQSRNFRGEELSNKRPGAIIFKRDKKSTPASVFFLGLLHRTLLTSV